jgi:predicted HicB family RNase H-like nuclease
MKEKKSFNVRISKELWVFLKNESARTEKSMIELIENCIIKMKSKAEKKSLTSCDADV